MLKKQICRILCTVTTHKFPFPFRTRTWRADWGSRYRYMHIYKCVYVCVCICVWGGCVFIPTCIHHLYVFIYMEHIRKIFVSYVVKVEKPPKEMLVEYKLVLKSERYFSWVSIKIISIILLFIYIYIEICSLCDLQSRYIASYSKSSLQSV